MYLRLTLNRVRAVHRNECMPIVVAQEMLDAQAAPDLAHGISINGGPTASLSPSNTLAEIPVEVSEFLDLPC